MRREKDVILSVCFERYEGASASVGAFLCDPTQLARLVVCRLPSLSEEVVVPVWRAFRDELRLVLGLRWVTSPPARIGRSLTLTLELNASGRLLSTDQVRQAGFPDVPPASSRTPDHLSILEPRFVWSPGLPFIKPYSQANLQFLCLRKISKGAAPILLECVVKLGTPNAGDQWHKICPRAGRSS